MVENNTETFQHDPPAKKTILSSSSYWIVEKTSKNNKGRAGCEPEKPVSPSLLLE